MDEPLARSGEPYVAQTQSDQDGLCALAGGVQRPDHAKQPGHYAQYLIRAAALWGRVLPDAVLSDCGGSACVTAAKP